MANILIGLVILLMCTAIVWIFIRVIRQWNGPKNRYQKQMQDIQRRKRELGLVEEE